MQQEERGKQVVEVPKGAPPATNVVVSSQPPPSKTTTTGSSDYRKSISMRFAVFLLFLMALGFLLALWGDLASASTEASILRELKDLKKEERISERESIINQKIIAAALKQEKAKEEEEEEHKKEKEEEAKMEDKKDKEKEEEEEEEQKPVKLARKPKVISFIENDINDDDNFPRISYRQNRMMPMHHPFMMMLMHRSGPPSPPRPLPHSQQHLVMLPMHQGENIPPKTLRYTPLPMSETLFVAPQPPTQEHFNENPTFILPLESLASVSMVTPPPTFHSRMPKRLFHHHHHHHPNNVPISAPFINPYPAAARYPEQNRISPRFHKGGELPRMPRGPLNVPLSYNGLPPHIEEEPKQLLSDYYYPKEPQIDYQPVIDFFSKLRPRNNIFINHLGTKSSDYISINPGPNEEDSNSIESFGETAPSSPGFEEESYEKDYLSAPRAPSAPPAAPEEPDADEKRRKLVSQIFEHLKNPFFPFITEDFPYSLNYREVQEVKAPVVSRLDDNVVEYEEEDENQEFNGYGDAFRTTDAIWRHDYYPSTTENHNVPDIILEDSSPMGTGIGEVTVLSNGASGYYSYPSSSSPVLEEQPQQQQIIQSQPPMVVMQQQQQQHYQPEMPPPPQQQQQPQPQFHPQPHQQQQPQQQHQQQQHHHEMMMMNHEYPAGRSEEFQDYNSDDKYYTMIRGIR